MRTMIHWAIIVSSMATSCYLNAAEEPATEEQSEADRARILEWQKSRDQWLKADEGKAYVFWLCSLSGEERVRALEKAARDYLIIPSEARPSTPNAEARGYRVLECAQQRTSALGYTWSNAALWP